MGTYVYRTTFDLTGFDPNSARITCRVATDDSLELALLNGSSLNGTTSTGFSSFAEFTIPPGSPFFSGINTLEFVVNNGGQVPGPTGLRVEMTGRANGFNEAPSVFVHPQSQNVSIGGTVVFTVDAEGTPQLNYQWRFNNAPIPGANNTNYTITGVTTNNAGNYSVTISNFAGQTNSANALLTVLNPFPGIYNTGVDFNRQPLLDGEIDPHYKLILNAHNPNSLDAFAQFTIPSSWITNGGLSRWIGPLPDATAAGGNYSYQLLLDLTGFDASTAFLSGRWATDDGGSLFLNGADTGFRSPDFTTFSSFSLTNVFVSGTNVLEFRVANGSGPTGLRVENLIGSAQPRTTTNFPPRIVFEPEGGPRAITDSITMTVVADGTPPLSYQWYRYNQSLGTTELLPGKTNTSLTFSSLVVADAGDYNVRVTNSLGSATSALAGLTVFEPQLGIFNTGVDANGTALPPDQLDPHYVLVSSPDDLYIGPPTYANAHPAWFANDADSGWISARMAGDAIIAAGNYRYRLIFRIDTSNDVATAAITGNVGSDDGNGGVFLNGNPVPIGSTGYGNLTSMAIPAGSPFVVGLNTLDFVVNNAGTSANPSGLRVDNLNITGLTSRPRLTIRPNGPAFQISWPASPSGFVLQEASTVSGSWTNSLYQGFVQGNEKIVIIKAPGPTKFFRLRK